MASTARGKAGKAESKGHHTPEKELAFVVLEAGELGDVRYLKDYLQMTKLSGELNINEIDSKGCSSLHFAVASKKIDVVKTLVEYGANVNQRDFMGFTALFWATGRYADVEIARYLIESCRASVHITTERGACALHGAALQGNADCIELLLRHGADARCKDNNESTPLDLARDEATKAILYRAITSADLQADMAGRQCVQCGLSKEAELKRCGYCLCVIGSLCVQCGLSKEAALKRCGRCFVAKYCGRDCQLAHWSAGHRKLCPGFVSAQTKSSHGEHTTTIHHSSLTVHFDKDAAQQSEALKKKKFIVKVQVPVGVNGQCIDGRDMMVYNEDRSVTGYITAAEKGYGDLRNLIAKEGNRGIKAFFWAELDDKLSAGALRVFHGGCAPYKNW